MSQFGYGGKGYGGFGTKGQYGGYRSYYPTNPQFNPLKQTYEVNDGPPVRMHAQKVSIDDWLPARAYRDSTTFAFGLFLLVIIGLGFFFGMRNRRRLNPFLG